MSTDKIQIYIETSKPYYYFGENLLASILIESFDSINISNLEVIIKGKIFVDAYQKYYLEEDEEESEEEYSEKIAYEANEDKSKEINFIQKRNSSNLSSNENLETVNESTPKEMKYHKTLFKYKKNINIDNNILSKGKYNFPFEVELPNDMPGSFLFLEKNTYAEVIYSIKVKTFLDNNSQKIIKEIIPIILRQKERIFNYQKSSEYSKKIGKCCLEQGESTIKVNMVNNYSLLKGMIETNILVNNEKCGVDGNPINIELYQRITLFPSNKSENKSKIKITKLATKYLGKNIINKNDIYNENLKFTIKKNPTFADERISQTKIYKIIKKSRGGENLGGELFPFLCQSVKSKYISCEYEMCIETKFKGWSQDELTVFIPVLLYPMEKCFISDENENKNKLFIGSISNKKIYFGQNDNQNIEKEKENEEKIFNINNKINNNSKLDIIKENENENDSECMNSNRNINTDKIKNKRERKEKNKKKEKKEHKSKTNNNNESKEDNKTINFENESKKSKNSINIKKSLDHNFLNDDLDDETLD